MWQSQKSLTTLIKKGKTGNYLQGVQMFLGNISGSIPCTLNVSLLEGKSNTSNQAKGSRLR